MALGRSLELPIWMTSKQEGSMSRLFIRSSIVLASLIMATTGFAEPPDHAPAHGYRAKHKEPSHPDQRPLGGFEIVFDSERGISIAAGFPGVYVHAGEFYRQQNGIWQVSARADGGWKTVKAEATPDSVRKAHSHPGPATPKGKRR